MHPFIDECQPWPDHPEPVAKTVRDIIEHRHYTPEWKDGAGYALAVILSHLSSSMTVDELQEFMEDVADDVAPRTDKTDEEMEIEGFEEWTEAQECVFCHHSFAPEGVAYSIAGTDRACVCKACDKKAQPF